MGLFEEQFTGDEHIPDQDLTKEEVLFHATNLPHKVACQFFQKYFKDGGGKIHPTLGDLSAFVQEIEEQWSEKGRDCGSNLVSSMIQHHLSKLGNAVIDSSEGPTERSGNNPYRFSCRIPTEPFKTNHANDDLSNEAPGTR